MELYKKEKYTLKKQILFLFLISFSMISCSKKMKLVKYDLIQISEKYILANYSREDCGISLNFEGDLEYICDK